LSIVLAAGRDDQRRFRQFSTDDVVRVRHGLLYPAAVLLPSSSSSPSPTATTTTTIVLPSTGQLGRDDDRGTAATAVVASQLVRKSSDGRGGGRDAANLATVVGGGQ